MHLLQIVIMEESFDNQCIVKLLLYQTPVPTAVSKLIFFLQESPITKHLQAYGQHLKHAPLTSSKNIVSANKVNVSHSTSIQFLGEAQGQFFLIPKQQAFYSSVVLE